MKNLAITILLFIVSITSGNSQSNFAYYYSTSPGASANSNPIISLTYDGSIIGINGFSIFKTDLNGNMLWQKVIDMGPITNISPSQICMLSDSTLVIVVQADSNNDDFLLIKCDLSGNILWAKVYACLNSFLIGSLDLEPGDNGGVIVTCSNWVVFINAAGNVESAFSFSYPYPGDHYALQTASAGPGLCKVWGLKATVSDTAFFLFDIDTSGIISNYFTYSIVGETPSTGGFVPPANFISTSPSGHTYCFYGLQSSGNAKSVIFHMDAQNQPIWAKRITGGGLRGLYAREDNGCILSGSSGYFPAILRLDSTGLIKCNKTLGDFSSSNYFGILNMVPDTGSGWYSILSKPNINLIHTDSLFNGYCHYATNTLAFAPLTVAAIPDSITTIILAFTEWDFTPTISPQMYYRYDACSDVLIDSSTSISETFSLSNNILIYPNPARENVTISFPEKVMNGNISIYNLIGEKLTENYLNNQSEKTLWLDQLPSGMYFIHVDGQMHYSQKFVVHKE